MPKTPLTVAAYLTQQLALCDKPQTEIAADCGYPNPNIIAMFKSGKTKVPLVAIHPLSKSLGIDPGYFLRLAMTEYMPEAWEALESILQSSPLVTRDEVELIRIIRDGADGRPIDPGDDSNRRELRELAARLAQRDSAKAQAAVERLEALPKNARHKKP